MRLTVLLFIIIHYNSLFNYAKVKTVFHSMAPLILVNVNFNMY